MIRSHKRTLSLQIQEGGRLVARAPYLMPTFIIDKFIRDKASWITKKRLEMTKPKKRKVAHFTIQSLQIFIARQVKLYAKKMELTPTSLRFTHVKSYWGTCNPQGVLSFNLSLRYAPKDAVTYVIVHELAHLRFRGHGKRFWNLVKLTYPKTQAMRQILRQIPRSLSK